MTSQRMLYMAGIQIQKHSKGTPDTIVENTASLEIINICFREDGCMSFEDFLDMMSVLSQDAPVELKADWAFKVFGKLYFNEIFVGLNRQLNN